MPQKFLLENLQEKNSENALFSFNLKKQVENFWQAEHPGTFGYYAAVQFWIVMLIVRIALIWRLVTLYQKHS